MLPTSNLYKIEVLGNFREVQRRINDEEFDRQIHFYAGNPLRRGTLWANFGSFAQPFSVLSIVLDY